MRYISFHTKNTTLHIKADDIVATYEDHNNKTIELYVKGKEGPFIVNGTEDNHDAIEWLWEDN